MNKLAIIEKTWDGNKSSIMKDLNVFRGLIVLLC
jgi:hypothetical protein